MTLGKPFKPFWITLFALPKGVALERCTTADQDGESKTVEVDLEHYFGAMYIWKTKVLKRERNEDASDRNADIRSDRQKDTRNDYGHLSETFDILHFVNDYFPDDHRDTTKLSEVIHPKNLPESGKQF